jgi:uncharacterized membrane protein YeaQ/YmgE (transglycosylase-associated protein family)
MNFAMFATLVLVGLLTGWLAGFAMKDRGHGRLWDLTLGLIGSTVAGEIFALLGLAADAGIFVAAVVAFAGAAVVIIAQRQVWHAHA